MEESTDYAELVQQAQLGDKKCLNRLAEAGRERLHAYVYCYTLADDLTHDIVQESILKMLEALGELRETQQFWVVQGIFRTFWNGSFVWSGFLRCHHDAGGEFLSA